jgi:hypothetical protein
MKVIFWISTILVLIGNIYTFQGFVNVYYKNYNGGPESSSGSIKYVLLAGIAILISGLIFYFVGNLKIATFIMTLPVCLLLLYVFVMMLPYLLGGRMN